MNNILFFLLLLLGTLLSSVSQILLKISAKKHYQNIIQEYLNPFVIIAYLMLGCAMFFSLVAYQTVPLSFGPIIESTGYIYVTVFGACIFKEKICLKKVFALFLIVIGIVVFSLNWTK